METDSLPRFYTKFTVDGESPVCHHDGVEEMLPLPEVTLTIPENFTELHHKAMVYLGDWVRAIKMTRRQIPTLRDELLASGVRRSTLDELEAMRLVTVKVIPVDNTVTGKRTGARACVYYTPMGLTYMKEKVDEAVSDRR
jgi:hypothetical protein